MTCLEIENLRFNEGSLIQKGIKKKWNIFSMNPMVNIVSISYFCCVDGNSVSNRWLLIICHCDIVGVRFEFDAFW
jgi:hypothetical protein